MTAEERDSEPPFPPPPGGGEANAGPDEHLHEFFLANSEPPEAHPRRRDALQLSGALVAAIVIAVGIGVALVAAIPFLVQLVIVLMLAADTCQNMLQGCG